MNQITSTPPTSSQPSSSRTYQPDYLQKESKKRTGIKNISASTKPIIKYACLHSECHSVFEMWNDARKHMANVCHYPGKPKRVESAKKAESLVTEREENVDKTLAAQFSGKLKISYAPSEEELVEVVKKYYSEGPATNEYRKHVMNNAIRPKYGNFPFRLFGFGTFKEFSIKHNISAYK